MSNRRLIQDLYDSFGKGDIPAVLEKFDASIAWREAEGNPYQPSGEAWIGPDAVVENLFAKLGAEWDAFTVHVREIHDAGNAIIVEGRYTGRYVANSKDLDAQFSHVWKLDGGRITSFQQYTDTGQMQRVMSV